MSDATIITAIIGGIFAGLALLAKVMLPYLRKSPEQPSARELLPTQRAAMATAADWSGGHPALDLDDIPNTGGVGAAAPQPVPPNINQTLGAIHQTLSDINSKSFATTADVQRFSDTLSKQVEAVNKKADTNTGNIAAIQSDVSYIRGKLDK